MGSFGNSSASPTGEAELLKRFVEENWSKHGFYPRAVGEGVCEIVMPQHAMHLEFFIEDLVAAGASNISFMATEEECKLDVYTEDGVAGHLKKGALARWAGRFVWILLWLFSLVVTVAVANKFGTPTLDSGAGPGEAPTAPGGRAGL